MKGKNEIQIYVFIFALIQDRYVNLGLLSYFAQIKIYINR